MPYDFSSLFQDPQFQAGMSLLGSANTMNPWASAQQSMMEVAKAKQLQAYQQAQMNEQAALAAQHGQETRKLTTINDLLAQAVAQRQARMYGGPQQQPRAQGMPQQDMGPSGNGLRPPQGYNWNGQNVNPFNGFTTPGQNQIGGQPGQGGIQNTALMNAGEQLQQGQNSNEVMPALNPDAEMWALAGNNELAKMYQQAYGQNFLPNGMAYGHTYGGSIVPVPGSYENLQRHEEMQANVKRAHELVTVPLDNGNRVQMSGLEADTYNRTGQLPQRVIDQFGLPSNPTVSPNTPTSSHALAYAPAQNGGAPASLHQAVLGTESGGNPNAIGPYIPGQGTAKGSMQVMDRTNAAPGYGVTPAQNNSAAERTRVGHDYLDAMHKRYQDPTLAAIAYNMGPEATDKWLAAGGDYSRLPAETKNYVGSVMTKQAVAGNAPQAAPTANPNVGMKAAPRVGVEQSPAAAAQADIFAREGAKNFLAIQANGKTALADLGNMQLLDAYLKKIGNTGMAAPGELGFYKVAQGLGFKVPNKASDLESAQIMGNAFAMKLRNPSEGGGLPGQMSNYEDRMLRAMMPNIDKLPGANRIIASMYMKQKQRTVVQAKLAAQWRAEGVPLDEIDQRLIKHAEDNPFFSKEDEAAIMGASGQGRTSVPTADKRGATGDWESVAPANNGVKFLRWKE